MIDVIDLLQAAEDDDDNNIVYSPYPSHPYILLLHPYPSHPYILLLHPYLLFSPSHTPPISLCHHTWSPQANTISSTVKAQSFHAIPHHSTLFHTVLEWGRCNELTV